MSDAKRVRATDLPRILEERARATDRIVVAIAGPPAAGKSTLAKSLASSLNALSPGTAVVVPMDGFHYDNAILENRKLLTRKGAPETFDFDGLRVLLDRLRPAHEDIAIPVFDRELDLARASAEIVARTHRIVIVEGNYLLLSEEPWSTLADGFDITCYLEVPPDELEQRLVHRWISQGFEPDAARTRALSNDLPNARRVAASSKGADFIVAG